MNKYNLKLESFTIDGLKKADKEFVKELIRDVLTTGDTRLRFEMSGYEGETGSVTIHNQMILNLFAKLGIYDYTDYLFLDFYKGGGTLYYCYFQTHDPMEIDFLGLTTTEIIYEIFQLTIFTNFRQRRRS